MCELSAGMVTSFLQYVHGNAVTLARTDRVVISAKMDGKYRSRTFTLDDLDAAGEAAARASDNGLTTYCRIHLIDRDIPTYERGKSVYTSLVTHLAADVDIAGPGHKPPEGRELPPSLDTAVELIDNTLPPSAIIDSGGGLYPIWRLAEPFEIVDVEAYSRVRNLGQRLDKALASHDWHVDATVLDLARVIRPPGVINHKPGRDPRPVTVLRGYVDGVGDYTLADLERLLPELPPPPPRKPHSTRPSNGTAAWEIFARDNTIEDVLAADPKHSWERVKDQGGMPAWRRSGSDSDYSIKQSPAGVVIIWSSIVAADLDVDPGDGLDLWGFACRLAGMDPADAARAVKR